MPYKFDRGIMAACQIGLLSDLYETFVGYKTDGFFVEIGAFDGYSWSNTLPLIEEGWRGIMVEPDPENFAILSKNHQANDKLALVQAAICNTTGMTLLYQGGSISTTVRRMVSVFRKTPGVPLSGMSENKPLPVVSYTTDDMLALYHCPPIFDVLSIDVEGGELGVLNTYTPALHKAKMAIVEYDDDSPSEYLRKVARGVLDFFKKHGYTRVYYDGMNGIFVDNRL